MLEVFGQVKRLGQDSARSPRDSGARATCDIDRIHCESDEDYVVVYANQLPEFVSVKHREPDQGPWTLSTICTDGGLKHLFNTWREKDQLVRCKLQTNAGLKTGEKEARRLATACNNNKTDDFPEFIPALKP